MPKTLTKFSIFREGLFNDDAGIKISLPAEFNDSFDAQLRFSDQEIDCLVDEFNSLPDANVNKGLAIFNNDSIELNKIVARKPITPEAIKYYIQRLQTIHILCLNSISSVDFNTSPMWGIYANNGKGLALEFDYMEIENRFNHASLKSFLRDFYHTNDKDDFIRSSLNDDVLGHIKEFVKQYNAENAEDFLKSDTQDIKDNPSDFVKLLYDNNFSSMSLTNNLIPITYNSRFDTLVDIFKTYVLLIISGNYHNAIGYNLANSFFSNKHNIWQNEHEYRLIIPNFVAQLINEVESSNGFNEKNANFNNAISDLKLRTEGLGIKTLKFKENLELSSFHYESNELDGNMPFDGTLPFPTKIYLGWNFKIYECETCRDVVTKEFLAIQSFRNRVKNNHGILIELYKLKEEVDYPNNKFNIGELIPL